MLDAKRIEKIIYHYVKELYGENEAYAPSWDIPNFCTQLAKDYDDTEFVARLPEPEYCWEEEDDD